MLGEGPDAFEVGRKESDMVRELGGRRRGRRGEVSSSVGCEERVESETRERDWRSCW